MSWRKLLLAVSNMGWVMSFIYFYFIQIFLPNATHYLHKSLFKYLVLIIMARSHRDQLQTRERPQKSSCPWRISPRHYCCIPERENTNPCRVRSEDWALAAADPFCRIPVCKHQLTYTVPSITPGQRLLGTAQLKSSAPSFSWQNPHGSNVCLHKGLLSPPFLSRSTPEVLGEPCHPEQRGSTSPHG